MDERESSDWLSGQACCLGRGRESDLPWADRGADDLQKKLGCCHPKQGRYARGFIGPKEGLDVSRARTNPAVLSLRPLTLVPSGLNAHDSAGVLQLTFPLFPSLVVSPWGGTWLQLGIAPARASAGPWQWGYLWSPHPGPPVHSPRLPRGGVWRLLSRRRNATCTPVRHMLQAVPLWPPVPSPAAERAGLPCRCPGPGDEHVLVNLPCDKMGRTSAVPVSPPRLSK